MNVIFLGPPGAGKGTIAKEIEQAMGLPQISTGDLFRSHIANQTDLGKQVKAILDSGELVPDSITTEMVKNRLEESDCKDGALLDGYPRTLEQARALKTFAQVDVVINFVISKESVVKRLSGRRIAKGSGKIYHVMYNPPKKEGVCDISGEPLIQREDDKEEAILNRLSVYEKQTAPLIDFYTEEQLIKNIDAEVSIAEVTKKTLSLLKG